MQAVEGPDPGCVAVRAALESGVQQHGVHRLVVVGHHHGEGAHVHADERVAVVLRHGQQRLVRAAVVPQHQQPQVAPDGQSGRACGRHEKRFVDGSVY